MIEAELILGAFETFLDCPAQTGNACGISNIVPAGAKNR
jgi:hypothetical protein